MVNVGKWAFLGGVVLAVVAGFFEVPYVMMILAILGLIVGFLNVTSEESHRYLMAVVALLLIGTASISALEVVGTLYELAADITSNVIAFVATSGLVVAVKEVLQMGKPGNQKE